MKKVNLVFGMFGLDRIQVLGEEKMILEQPIIALTRAADTCPGTARQGKCGGATSPFGRGEEQTPKNGLFLGTLLSMPEIV